MSKKLSAGTVPSFKLSSVAIRTESNNNLPPAAGPVPFSNKKLVPAASFSPSNLSPSVSSNRCPWSSSIPISSVM